MADREWRYVANSEVPAYEVAGWINTGETTGHHGHYSSMMYRYVDDGGADMVDRFPDAQPVKTSTASAEGGTVVVTFVTDSGFVTLRLSPDNLSSHIARCARAMSDLIPSSAGRAGAAASPRNEGSNPVAG